MDIGVDFTDYLRYVAALIFVLALIWVASFVLKRMMGHRLGIKRRGENRLSVSENLPIDSRHRLVLVRCDEQEHLILLGHEDSIVIGEPLAVTARETDSPSLDTRQKKEPAL